METHTDYKFRSEIKYGDGVSWRRGKILGKGNFGTVFLATCRLKYTCFPEVMAIKSAEVSRSGSIQKEKEVLDILNKCPHIIGCFGEETTFGENGTMAYNMLLEYGSGGTLSDRIKNSAGGGGKGLPEFEAKYYTKSLLLGLKYMRDTGYVHRDMKPENILLVRKDEAEVEEKEVSNQFRAKISDFGMAKKEQRQTNRKRKLEGYWRGTPMYLSPEAVKNHEQDCPSDIWALGCIVLKMLTGEDPWDLRKETSDEDLLRKIGWGRQVPKIPKELSKDSKDFLKKCFLKNPRNRWTAAMLLDHPFVAGIPDEDEDGDEDEDDLLQDQFQNHYQFDDVGERKRRKCVIGSSTVNINSSAAQYQGVC